MNSSRNLPRFVEPEPTNTAPILLRNSTITALKELNYEYSENTYDILISKMIKVYRKTMEQEQWQREYKGPNPLL
jgi:HD superfamily phosphohydrolase YqeK